MSVGEKLRNRLTKLYGFYPKEYADGTYYDKAWTGNVDWSEYTQRLLIQISEDGSKLQWVSVDNGTQDVYDLYKESEYNRAIDFLGKTVFTGPNNMRVEW